MLSDELLCCPFCGSSKLKIDSKRNYTYEHDKITGAQLKKCSVSVRCGSCHARGPVVGVKVPDGEYNEKQLVEQAVVEAWNNRKPIKDIVIKLKDASFPRNLGAVTEMCVLKDMAIEICKGAGELND